MFTRRARWRTLAISAFVPALVGVALASPAEAQRIDPDFFGMGAGEWSVSAARSPKVAVGAANFTTAAVYWYQVERQAPDLLGNRTYDWSRLEQQVVGAEGRQARPMIVMGATPRHASTCPDSPDYTDCMPKEADWRAYVRALATKYRTRLDYQIWPEPNIIQNWRGTPAQMAQLTKIASEEVKAATAGAATVVAPALAVRTPDQQKWAADYYKALVGLGGGRVDQIVDVVALDPFPAITGTPEDGVGLVNGVRNQLRRLGVSGVEYWTNEINYGVQGANVPTRYTLPEAKQQSYVIRTYALHAAAGVGRVYWHLWNRDPGTAVHMTDTAGRSLAPAQAYGVVRNWLLGTTVTGCSTNRTGVTVCTAKKSAREVRRIYWKAAGRGVVKLPRTAYQRQLQTGRTIRTKGGSNLRIDFKPVLVLSKR